MDGDAATAKIGKLIRALVFFGFDLCQRVERGYPRRPLPARAGRSPNIRGMTTVRHPVDNMLSLFYNTSIKILTIRKKGGA